MPLYTFSLSYLANDRASWRRGGLQRNPASNEKFFDPGGLPPKNLSKWAKPKFSHHLLSIIIIIYYYIIIIYYYINTIKPMILKVLK